MLTSYLMMALATLAVTWPAYILPLIISPIVLIKYRSFGICRAAAIFTLKPVIATPIWGVLFFLSLENDAPYFLTILPGMILTIIIVVAFKQLFVTHTSLFALLLVVDVLRWLITFLLASPSLGSSFRNTGAGQALSLMPFILPNVYAVMALYIGILQSKQLKASSQALIS